MEILEIRRPLALRLIVVSLGGAGVKLAAQLDEGLYSHPEVAHDAGPLSGTILHQQEGGGFAALDSRHPVELRRQYRGGALGDYL